jgi:D-amino-acid dehydrogenase
LIERDAPGAGASFGNGAVIGEDAVVPVATPGILRQVPAMLRDPLGPLAVRWGYLPRIAPWLARFLAASSPRRVEEISVALAALLRGSLAATAELLEAAGAPGMLRRSGWLCVFETEAGFAAYRPMLELQRRRGVRHGLMGAPELRRFEPALAPIFARAIHYPDVGYVLDSQGLVELLVRAIQARGGVLRKAEAHGFDIGPEGPRAVLTGEGPVPCDAVVVAAGAWSRRLAALLGARVPLDTERGYHVQFAAPGVAPGRPIYSTERGIVATPLEAGLRVAGTVELGGLDAVPNWGRAEVLRTQARRWFPDLRAEPATRWMGFRPSMPDSLPVIGRSPRFANAILAFGHGHCGMMMGARTGQLVTALLTGVKPGIDLRPYRAERF